MPKRIRAAVTAAKKRETTESEVQESEISSPARQINEDGEGDEAEDADLIAFQLPFKKDKQIPCETRSCPSLDTSPSMIFTHGAGGGLESSAMRSFAAGFARCGRITSFQGNMNLTSRVNMFRVVADHHSEKHRHDSLILGGRSMGARAAVLTALELISESVEVHALILVSYPLTASKNGKQEREFERREKILLDLPESVDVLFVSGTRDVQCNLEALKNVREEMKAKSWMVEAKGADHGMEIVPKVGTNEMGELMGEVAANWLKKRDEGKRLCEICWDDEEGKACQEEWQSGDAATDAQQPGHKKRKTA